MHEVRKATYDHHSLKTQLFLCHARHLRHTRHSHKEVCERPPITGNERIFFSPKRSQLICLLKEMLYAVRCLKSNEDMILALAGQFKQLSHEPEKFR